MAEWLGHLTSDHMVLGSNFTGDGFQLMTVCCLGPFIITPPSSQYNLNDVERDVKHQIVIIIVGTNWFELTVI